MADMTLFRFYFQKLTPEQKDELVEKMGLNRSTLYRKIQLNGRTLTLNEASVFVEYISEKLQKQISIESLVKEVQP